MNNLFSSSLYKYKCHLYIDTFIYTICLSNGTNVTLQQFTLVCRWEAFTNVAMCAKSECELFFPFFWFFHILSIDLL